MVASLAERNTSLESFRHADPVMKLIALYLRVLGLLSRDARLAWALGAGNLALAATQFAEPVLFGRVIDALSGAQSGPARCCSVWSV